MSLGMALNGMLPVTCYPRFDFLLFEMNQLVNHTDKINHITRRQFSPRMIIRVLVGAKKSLDGDEQHTQNYIREFKNIFEFIKVYDLFDEKKIFQVIKKLSITKK